MTRLRELDEITLPNGGIRRDPQHSDLVEEAAELESEYIECSARRELLLEDGKWLKATVEYLATVEHLS